MGKFVITSDVMFEDPEIVQLVMARCIVVRAELMMITDNVEYYAYSPEFDENEIGVRCPTYEIEISRDEAGSHSIMFKRRD